MIGWIDFAVMAFGVWALWDIAHSLHEIWVELHELNEGTWSREPSL